MKLYFLYLILSCIRNLQKANKAAQKHLADAYDQVEVRMLIKQIQQRECIEFDQFDNVYTRFVERKREGIDREIRRINSQFVEYLRGRQEAGLPNEGIPAKTQMELAVLETCYAYLRDDNAYQQRAFTLFLEKRLEEMQKNTDECREIEAYLEDKYRDSNYDAYIECISRPADVHLPRLWAEFFKSGAEYNSIIPKERPDVAYPSTDTDLPRFIFQPPFVQYSQEEFIARFIQEFNATHQNPSYDDGCDDPAYYADYDSELADRPQNGYLHYLCAVNRFKQIRQRLKQNARTDR